MSMLEQFSGADIAEINGIMSSSSVLDMLMTQTTGDHVKPEPGGVSPWPANEDHRSDDFARTSNYGSNNVSGFYYHHQNHHRHIPRTISCPPNMASIESDQVGEGFKKRKSSAAADDDEKSRNFKAVAEERSPEKKKKMKGCTEEEEKKSKGNSKSTTDSTINGNNKETSKASEAPKPDYIHVRARRGQATDSHSLAERVRREKISERMRYLQDLVPGCNKVTGKAGMLDEIINYVQSLQKQVEFLSMKLAAMNTPMEFDVDNYLSKEVYTANAPTVGGGALSSSSANSHHHQQLQINDLMSEGIQYSNMGIGILDNNTPQDFTALRRTTSAPVSALIQDSLFLDSPCLNFPWDDDLQNLYSMEFQQGRSTATFMPQPFSGYFESHHVKQEM